MGCPAFVVCPADVGRWIFHDGLAQDLSHAPLMLGGGGIRDGGFVACSADAGRWSYP